MLFYYVRHGEPIYDPDSLTEYGKLQAEALAKRMSYYGLDRIYASTSNRAKMTAAPTCKALGIEPVLLDFANENHAWTQMAVEIKGSEGQRTWAFSAPEYKDLFSEPEVYALGDKWYDSPLFAGTKFKEGTLRIDAGVDALFEELGYRHDRSRRGYEIINESEERVALFAHAGFGMSFLSSVLDIPYPIISTRFDISHSSVTVIEFPNPKDGSLFCRPKVLQWANDSHLFAADVLRPYNNRIKV